MAMRIVNLEDVMIGMGISVSRYKRPIGWRKQFCLRGHDTFAIKRLKNGKCSLCSKEAQRKSYIPHPRVASRFCKYGHDTFVTGRTNGKKQYCKLCKRNWTNNYINRKIKSDPTLKLVRNLRVRLWDAIKHNFKAGSAVRDLGCSIQFLKQYIEKKFYNGMTWDNWNEIWELDHIKELHTFDLTDREQFLEAVHYTNLQPLLIADHLKKTLRERYK
jgi:hypothetical protein